MSSQLEIVLWLAALLACLNVGSQFVPEKKVAILISHFFVNIIFFSLVIIALVNGDMLLENRKT